MNSTALRPRSCGTLRLRSDDPRDEPLIDPNYLADPYDREMAVKSVRIIREVLRQPAIAPLIESERLPGAAALSDEEIMANVRQYAAATTTRSPAGEGRGGGNVEFLLGLAVALHGQPGVWALAGDTDGGGPAAGALVTPDTLARARALGRDPRAMLAANDAHPLFEALGDAVVTGPTLTNVNDFRAILVTAP